MTDINAGNNSAAAQTDRKKAPGKPKPAINPQAASEAAAKGSAQPSSHDRVIDALLDRLSTTPWPEISLGQIAQDADMDLAQLRALFPSKGAIFAGFARRIDVQSLKAVPSTVSPDETPREKLAVLLQNRFQAMVPHKAALQRFSDALKTDPAAALAWNRVLLTSAQWTLAAACIPETGISGTAKAQGLVVLLVKVMPVWLNDDTADQSETREALDRELARVEKWLGHIRGFMANIPFWGSNSRSSASHP
jgi:AcrR family transcriptional regulator